MSDDAPPPKKNKGGRPKAGVPTRWEREQGLYIGSNSTLNPPSQAKRQVRQTYADFGTYKRGGWAAMDGSEEQLDERAQQPRRKAVSFKKQRAGGVGYPAGYERAAERARAPAARASRAPTARKAAVAAVAVAAASAAYSPPDSEDSIKGRKRSRVGFGRSRRETTPSSHGYSAESDGEGSILDLTDLIDQEANALEDALDAAFDDDEDGVDEGEPRGVAGRRCVIDNGTIEPPLKKRCGRPKRRQSDMDELKPRHLKGKKLKALRETQRVQADARTTRRLNPPPPPGTPTEALSELLVRLLCPRVRRWCMYEVGTKTARTPYYTYHLLTPPLCPPPSPYNPPPPPCHSGSTRRWITAGTTRMSLVSCCESLGSVTFHG